MLCRAMMTLSKMYREVLFLDIVTDASGRLRGYVHKRCTQGLRRTYSIQKNLKLGHHRPPITHKIYSKSLQVDSEILFEYKTIQLIRSRMASHFLVKLNFNEIENEQRSVILIYIIKRMFSPWEENAKPF